MIKRIILLASFNKDALTMSILENRGNWTNPDWVHGCLAAQCFPGSGSGCTQTDCSVCSSPQPTWLSHQTVPNRLTHTQDFIDGWDWFILNHRGV